VTCPKSAFHADGSALPGHPVADVPALVGVRPAPCAVQGSTGCDERADINRGTAAMPEQSPGRLEEVLAVAVRSVLPSTSCSRWTRGAPLNPDLMKGCPPMSDQHTVALIDEFFDLVRDFIVKHDLGYGEYAAVMKYLISLGESGEWPLFLDAFFETTVNTTSYCDGPWTPSTITGPFYKPGAPILTERPATLPMRPDEPGEPLIVKATVTAPDGAPVPGALVDVWHATNDGSYTFFAPHLRDEYLLRGRIHADDNGLVEFRSIRPVPYEIPKDGPVGQLMNDVLGRHSWRPAHLHFLVTAEGFAPLITQLYFADDPYLDNDSCAAVKNELVVTPSTVPHGGGTASLIDFPFVLQPSSSAKQHVIPSGAPAVV
jgi:catechol 1,2-dioxygenase